MVSYTDSPFLSTLRYKVPEPEVGLRKTVCDQIILGLRDFYTHLPQKMAATGIDPIVQLTNLKQSDGKGFTRSLLRIISSLRDRHTTLKLPAPWNNMVAYVPFLVERVYDESHPRYIVTKQLFGFTDIPIGATVTHWNGVPVDLHVNALAAETQGANPPARLRLGTANLCIRPLAYVLMPSEDWVTLTYLDLDGEMKTLSTPWRFYMTPPAPLAQGTGHGDASLELGLDPLTLLSNKFKSLAPTTHLKTSHGLTTDGSLRYGTVQTPTGPCAYLRIFSFEEPDALAFVNKIAGILADLPQERLIIDVRENPGGLIPAGQYLIRLLTNHEITPAPIAFRSTQSTQVLADSQKFAQWEPSLALQNASANVWSQSFPINAYYEGAPDYRYPGKVALIIDALCYSTTDFFAADFVDNKIGTVVGVDPCTGGGGANVWPWSTLVQFANYLGLSEPQALPGGFDLNISMRRAYRTGAAAGLPIEDLAVPADIVHHITINDLLNQNQDLIATAAATMR